jgi:predicted ferric reductase
VDVFQLLENYGIPVVVTIVFGFFIWKQNQWIQGELLEELDEDNQRIENIIIKLIDQQKKVQLEQKQIRGYIEGIKDIMIKLVKEK